VKNAVEATGFNAQNWLDVECLVFGTSNDDMTDLGHDAILVWLGGLHFPAADLVYHDRVINYHGL
jgi:hypothetical protein